MRIRTVLAGIFAGGLCFPFLWFQYYRNAPSGFVPGWGYPLNLPIPQSWLNIGMVSLCGLILFACGWIAARWNWACTWQASLLAGAGAGVLAGCLLYDFIGAFWFGLHGQAEILQNFNTPLREAEGTRILIEAIFKTGTSIYSNFISMISSCTLVGAFGGLVSAWVDIRDRWGTHPRHPEGWLFRLAAYTLVPTGVLNLIVTIAVLQLLWEKTLNSAIKLEKQYKVQWTLHDPTAVFHVYGYAVGLLFILIPIGLTWGWFLHDWRARGKPNSFGVVWTLLTLIMGGYVLWAPLQNMNLFTLGWLVLIMIAVFIGLAIGLLAKPGKVDGSKPTFSDWLGHGLAFGIFAGTQIVMGATAFAIALALVAIINIPHLIGTGIVDKTPVTQVVYWYSFQSRMALVIMLICLVVGFILAGITSLLRGLLGIHEQPLRPDERAPDHQLNTMYKYGSH